MTENNSSKFKKRALALAVASCLSLSSMAAMAAGLGKLTVFSSLGQPLQAEMELSATPEELTGMTARLAPLDLFKQTGVEFSPVLNSLRFAVEKRPNGSSVIKLSSARPISEPFLDFLVELNWPTGRLVREYTFLLDPSEFSSAQGAQSSVDAKIVETVRGGNAAGVRAQAQAPSSTKQPVSPRETVTARPTPNATPDTRLVERGDTLRKIAAETQYAGVSLEQMLVGLYRNNRDAFIGNDIHRLKAGVILNIPDQATVAAVSDRDARNVYISSGDFSAYRRKLASVATASAARDAGPAAQSAGGRITPKIEEKTLTVDPSKDQVKVSRAEMSAKDAAASEIDRLARDKALQEAQARLAMLEKNVAELQKLLEMKNQRLAELERPVTTPEPAVDTPPAAAEPPAAAASSADAIKAEELKPPAPEVKPAEVSPQPVKAPPPAPPPAPPVEEEAPGLLDTLLADPLPLAGGAAVVALLTGLLVLRRRKQGDGFPKAPNAAHTSGTVPDSGFRTTGGQSVDTGSVPLHTGEFSQAGPGTIDTDDVDPVAEADVYMAYGRDTQAEEILLEAMQKDPSRLAIHAKLLEIYANRRSLKQFETLAAELYAQTAGTGPEWDKVAALGAGIDPNNPLYGANNGVNASAPAKDFDPASTLAVNPSRVAAVAAAGGIAGSFEAVLPADEPSKESANNFASEGLSFEIDADKTAESIDQEASMVSAPLLDALPDVLPETNALGDDSGMILDFDLGGELDSTTQSEASPTDDLQFEGLDALPLEGEPAPESKPMALDSSSEALDFDLSGMVGGETALDELKPVPEDQPAVNELSAMDLPSFGEPEGVEALNALEDIPGLSMPDVTPTAVPEADKSFDMEFGFDEIPIVSSDDLPEFDATAPVVEDDLMDMPTAKEDSSAADMDLSFEMPEMPGAAPDALPEPIDLGDFDLTPADDRSPEAALSEPEFDLASINLDLSSEPAEALSTTGISLNDDFAPLDAEPSIEAEAASDILLSEAEFAQQNDPRWEEVNTKLDLAKAYEEMGDLEGARELLQEVLGDGPTDLATQAQSILDRLGS